MPTDRRQFLLQVAISAAGVGGLAQAATPAQRASTMPTVQATKPLYEVLGAVIEEAKTIPVIAAGGIANGAHIRRALQAGASGVLIGTRFVATKEAGVHDDYKVAITRAQADDTVLTVCFSGSLSDPHDGWPNAPHRVLRNRTFGMWEAAGCPPAGKRPGRISLRA